MWYDNRGSPVPETLEVATELMFKIRNALSNKQSMQMQKAKSNSLTRFT